jgi:hypothetical protein
MADEVFQRRAEAVWVSLEPVGEELQHLRQLSCVGGVQGHSGHEVAAFSVPGVGASVRAGTVACLPAWGADTSSGTPSVSESFLPRLAVWTARSFKAMFSRG